MKSVVFLKDYIVKVSEQFRIAITPSDMLNNDKKDGSEKSGDDNCGADTNNSTGSFNKITNMLFYILSLPIYFCFLPFLLIPIVFFIISLICVCIPFFASIYTSLNFAWEISINSIKNILSIKDEIKNHYLSIMVALFVFFIMLKETGVLIKGFDENISLNFVSNITNLIIVLICVSIYTYIVLYCFT